MIVRTYNVLRRGFFLCAFFLAFVTSNANATYVYINDGVISQRVSDKLEEMGKELFEKSGISVYVVAPASLNGLKITEYEKQVAASLKQPFALFVLAKNEQQVDIIYSESLEGKFDKEGILSPFPWKGTVIPLLSVKKDNDKYNAATLNGYADLVEQIASSLDIKLESAIGSTNRNMLHFVKYGIYGFLLFIILGYYFKKVRRKNV